MTPDLSAGGSAKPDTLANKNVIYRARDAIVCMGYTGLAFIGNLPTDTWIAEKLTGLKGSDPFGTRFGSLPRWLDIGQAIELLDRELRASEIAALKTNFELVVVGWQWKLGKREVMRNRPTTPMAWLLRKPYSKPFEAVERLPLLPVLLCILQSSMSSADPGTHILASRVPAPCTCALETGPAPTEQAQTALLGKHRLEAGCTFYKRSASSSHTPCADLFCPGCMNCRNHHLLY